MLHLAGLFTHLFDPQDPDEDRPDLQLEPGKLSDVERNALGDPTVSRDTDRSETEEPRFASMLMPLYF